jgi:hypothetical protein
MSATIIELTFPKNEQIDEPSGLPLRRIFAPSYKALPFVTLKKATERTGDYRDAETWWNDVPTDDEVEDYQRGEAYARMAVAAIEADRCIPRGLQLTFEHIFLDAVRRREKRGKYSRSLASAASGFISELAVLINARAGGAA